MCLCPVHRELGGQRWALKDLGLISPASSQSSGKMGWKGVESMDHRALLIPSEEKDRESRTGVFSCTTLSKGFPLHRIHLQGNTRAPCPPSLIAHPRAPLHSPQCMKGMESFSAAILWLSSPSPVSTVSKQGAHLEPCPGWISATHMLRCGFGKHLALGSRPSE